MGTVSITTPSDGDTIDAADVNNPFNTIVNAINGNLDSNNVSAGGLTPANLVSGTGTSWSWQAWTPTLANLTLGNGTSVGKYIQIGKTVHFRWIFTLGSTSAVGTAPTITLPISPTGLTANDHVAFGTLYDSSATQPYWTRAVFVSGSIIKVFALNGATGPDGNISATGPFTWAVSDTMQLTGTYEAA